MKLGDVIRLIRIKHWVKEGFVFAPLMFSLKFTSAIAIGNTLLACIAFVLASSAVYIGLPEKILTPPFSMISMAFH